MSMKGVLSLVGLGLAIGAVLVASMVLGSYQVTFGEAWRCIFGGGQEAVRKVLFDMRLKRTITAVVVGVILGASGAAMQSALRNPLASPFTLGIQHAAALGAAVALMVFYGGEVQRFSVEVSSPTLVAGFAFCGAFLQTLLVLGISSAVGLSVYTVILVSVAMAFLTQAVLALLQYLFLNEIVVAAIVFWTFGETAKATWQETGIMALAAILLLLFLLMRSLDLDLLSVGDEVARSSGVRAGRSRFLVLLACSLGTALAVSFVGIIGFVGLVAGQMARLLLGWSNRWVIPGAALIGALVLSGSDLLGRTLLSPTVIPVGIMTSIIGSPLLIYLLLGGRHAEGARS